MHIAYSAVQTITQQNQPGKITIDEQTSLRYKAYQATCNKYSKEIAAIQKYIPGWLPAYRDA
jgi:hypothetical protein